MTLLEDASRPHGVTLAFTERTGGCSAGQYASLNLGDACGDDVAAVEKNRMLALEAVGAGKWSANLVNPKQVHGDHVVVVRSCDKADLATAVAEARSGADAVVCTARHVPVLLCLADCVPVVLVAPGGGLPSRTPAGAGPLRESPRRRPACLRRSAAARPRT